MSQKFSKQWAFSQQHSKAVKRLIRELTPWLVGVSDATPHQDRTQGIDYVSGISFGNLAVRIRRTSSSVDNRNAYLRAAVKSKSKTELEKIVLREYKASYYLFAWLEDDGTVDSYALVDFEKFMARQLWQDAEMFAQTEKWGEDTMIYLEPKQLDAAGCLLERRGLDQFLSGLHQKVRDARYDLLSLEAGDPLDDQDKLDLRELALYVKAVFDTEDEVQSFLQECKDAKVNPRVPATGEDWHEIAERGQDLAVTDKEDLRNLIYDGRTRADVYPKDFSSLRSWQKDPYWEDPNA